MDDTAYQDWSQGALELAVRWHAQGDALQRTRRLFTP